ncbi:MAG: tripartite tricarboxylate transporter substrate binding protein [Alcaligenaceae bacterium]|nr:tripartite tricarboxylate transporter substrate binding protein [Alcaligenaceae bacterium]
MAALVCASCALLGSTQAAAQDYPQAQPLSLIVPYPAGGPSDASARIFSEAISEYLKQNVVVENIGGATGTIAARRMLSGKADGYTFFHGSPNELILPTLIHKAVTFKPEDFELVQAITTATIVVLTRADLDVNNLDDLIRLAKSRTDSPLTYGSVGNGSLYHLLTERIGKDTGITVEHVPYRGSSPALIDLAGGQIDFAVLAFQTSMIGLQEQGRIKILSALGNSVPEPLKDIPKPKDSEQLKDFDYGIRGGYFVKAGTPEEVKKVLRAAVGYALEKPDVREKLEIEGRIVYHPMTAEENEELWNNEISSLRNLIEVVGFEPI